MASRIAPARATSPARENIFEVMVSLLSILVRVSSKGRGVGLAGADAHRMVEAEDENLAVADLSGFRRRGDGLDDLVDLVGRTSDLELDLRQEAHGVFGAAIDLGVALLPPVALHLGDGQSLNADLGERVADLVELEGLDDGHDDFHCCNLPVARSCDAANGRAKQKRPRARAHGPAALLLRRIKRRASCG